MFGLVKKCKYCGKLVPENIKTCIFCGRTENEEKTSVQENLANQIPWTPIPGSVIRAGSLFTCARCGRTVNPGFKFCENCGAPLVEGKDSAGQPLNPPANTTKKKKDNASASRFNPWTWKNDYVLDDNDYVFPDDRYKAHISNDDRDDPPEDRRINWMYERKELYSSLEPGFLGGLSRALGRHDITEILAEDNNPVRFLIIARAGEDIFDVYGTEGQPLYEIHDELTCYTWRHVIEICDRNGKNVGNVKEKLFAIRLSPVHETQPRNLEITVHGHVLGHIKTSHKLLSHEWIYKADWNGWTARSPILGHVLKVSDHAGECFLIYPINSKATAYLITLPCHGDDLPAILFTMAIYAATYSTRSNVLF